MEAYETGRIREQATVDILVVVKDVASKVKGCCTRSERNVDKGPSVIDLEARVMVGFEQYRQSRGVVDCRNDNAMEG